MSSVTIADDLLIAAEPIANSSTFAGVAFSATLVVLRPRFRIHGVLQARSRTAIGCRVQLQSGWPFGRPLPDALSPSFPYQPAVWFDHDAIDVPVAGSEAPTSFSLASPPVFPLARVRWLLTGTLQATDYVIVSARIEPYFP